MLALNPALSGRARQDLDNFRREVRLMAAVQHAHVVPLVAARMLPPGPPQRSGSPVPARAAAHRRERA